MRCINTFKMELCVHDSLFDSPKCITLIVTLDDVVNLFGRKLRPCLTVITLLKFR